MSRRRSFQVALLLLTVALVAPIGGASAAAPARDRIPDMSKVVPMTLMSSGDVSTSGVVIGSCGWAGVFGYNLGHATARVTAMAYSSLGPILNSSWTENYLNNNSYTGGSRSGGGPQWPNSYWVPQPDWIVNTGSGTVLFGLPTLVVTIFYNGGLAYCYGGYPTDLERIT